MPVYVDDMRRKYGRLIMCHMLADSDHELRLMAEAIGVKQHWHQGDHFDICLAKRSLAIQKGAIEITQRQAAAMRRRRSITGILGSPEEAISWLGIHRAAMASSSTSIHGESM